MSMRLDTLAKGFGSPAIDRNKPLSFKLDGITINGFEGDTVLSAVMAAGSSGAGRIDGAPLALGPRLSPLVGLRGGDELSGVPMALCSARNGFDLTTLGAHTGALPRAWARLSKRLPASLGVDFATQSEKRAGVVTKKTEADLVVVGGGVAGMTAALAAARRGTRVVLIEMRGRLGGDAALFGNREGEEPVLDVVEKLQREIADEANIETRLLCQAVDAGRGTVTVTGVVSSALTLALEPELIAAPRIILATGCADRLAVFPGNRLPGLIGLGEAFHMAGTYGVWPTTPTLFAGGTNAMYRLALLAKDSGVDIVRLIDHRLKAQSRFIDFAKAMGVQQEFGTRLAAAETGKAGQMSVRTMLAWYDSRSEGRGLFNAGSVVMSDGWRPRLTLWARLGGKLHWQETGAVATSDRLRGGIALAGSATGLVTTDGCRASGERAVSLIHGEHAPPVKEHRVDDSFESPDAPPMRPLPSASERAFTSSSDIFVSMPVAPDARRRRRTADDGFDASGILDLESLDTLTRAGLAPADRFETLVTERLVSPIPVPGKRPRPARELQEADDDGVPAYLVGRFAEVLVPINLTSEDQRAFEPGMLVFADSVHHHSREAIGVIIGERENGGRAVLVASASNMARVIVRDGTRPLVAVVSETMPG